MKRSQLHLLIEMSSKGTTYNRSPHLLVEKSNMSFRPPMATPPRTSNLPGSVAREYASPAELEVSTATPAPTLRVMRLQKPELHISTTASSSVMTIPSPLRNDEIGTLLYEANSPSILQTALCLPDSLTVFVGETFTAYLGVLKTALSTEQPIRRLSVVAQLQTPSQRYPLPSRLETPQDVTSGVDSIVSRTMDEPGPHILRVEVSYLQASDGNRTSFRKFYRFQVRAPLLIHQAGVVRTSDTSCIISVHVEYPVPTESEKPEATNAMMLSSVEFEASDGLLSTSLQAKSASNGGLSHKDDIDAPTILTAVQLYDAATSLRPGGRVAFLFQLQAVAAEAVLRGLAAGDVLGRFAVTWRKAMGEHGTLYSPPVLCPKHFHCSYENGSVELPHCHVYRSGRSVDIAAAAAASVHTDTFYITVEPIDPPTKMQLHVPVTVQLLVVNHTSEALTGLQIQFPLAAGQLDVVVQGPSCVNVGPVAAHGGSIVTAVTWVALRAGLFRVSGGTVVDVASGRAAPQPPLWTTFVTE
jgi:trafficking protein particle complex subunit 13